MTVYITDVYLIFKHLKLDGFCCVDLTEIKIDDNKLYSMPPFAARNLSEVRLLKVEYYGTLHLDKIK